MSPKRLDGRALLWAALAVGMAASVVSAQPVNGVWQPTLSPNRGRVAAAAAPPAIVAVTPTFFAPTVFNQSFINQPVQTNQLVLVNQVPSILLSDGTVLANFGSGFEQVHSCATVVVIAGEPRVVAGNGRVLSRPAAPTYTQPVPNQITASQQLSSYTRAFGGSNAAQASCFTRDAVGRVFVNQFR